MWPRLSILAGLLAGVAVALLVLGGILAFAPEPGAAPTPAPQPSASIGLPSASPSLPAASPSASGGSGTPSASGAPSGSAVPSGGSSLAGLFHVGEPAPALSVPQVGGGTIDLANLKGQPVWVNFMATNCPPCVDEFPLMNGFAARYGDDGLVIVAIDVKEEEGAVAAFAESLNATFPLGLDKDGSAQQRWAALALPVHFWIDKDGIIRDGALGGIGPDVMVRGLKAIMPGVDITT
ncbi:MAG TPA: redoxin domain-containing protein [Methylomirabilota bacterium]|nr:redoxin domain-containing protein [Methylomirabilota bacterium]